MSELRFDNVVCHALGFGVYAHQRDGETRPFEWHGAEELDADLKRPGIDETFSDVCWVSRKAENARTVKQGGGASQ